MLQKSENVLRQEKNLFQLVGAEQTERSFNAIRSRTCQQVALVVHNMCRPQRGMVY